MSRTGFTLRNRKRIEVEARQVVIQRVGEHFAPRVLLRMEVRLEELLEHRRRDAAPPAPRQRRQNHRHVHVALVVRREDHRAFERGEMFTPLDARVCEQARQGDDPRGLRQAPDQPHRLAAVPGWKIDRLLDCLGGRRRFDQLLQIGDACGNREARFVDPRLEPILECDHQLDALERTDRKSTRLNSSHSQISYAVFCLKKKTKPRRAKPTSSTAAPHGTSTATASSSQYRPNSPTYTSLICGAILPASSKRLGSPARTTSRSGVGSRSRKAATATSSSTKRCTSSRSRCSASTASMPRSTRFFF